MENKRNIQKWCNKYLEQYQVSALSIFGSIGSFLKGVWNGIAQAWTASWNFIKAASIAWNGIKFAIQHPIQALKLALQTIWNAIKLSATLSWNAIKATVMFIIRSWLTGVKFYFGLWKTVITAVWNAIKFISVTAWNGIKNAVMFIIRGWLASVRLSLNMWKAVFTKSLECDQVCFNHCLDFY